MPETIKNFIVKNYIYLIVSIFYFVFAWRFSGFSLLGLAVLLNFYVLSLVLALSPAGEIVLRAVSGIRPLETKREKEYLLPIFEEVYAQAKEYYPILSEKIEMCIIDTMTINACAIGTKTVAVTKGAINTLSAEELKGIIAHEMGHIARGHTKLILLVTLGNGMFTIFALLYRLFATALEIAGHSTKNEFIAFVVSLFRFIVQVCLLVFIWLIEVALAVNSRANEYEADKFAYETGLGQNLIDSLYVLQDITLTERVRISQKLIESHPHIAKRIGTLEKMVDSER